jgi:hypothetical protein
MAPVTVESRTGKFPTQSILVPNHSSAIDPYLFGALPIENAFVTSWPFKIPVYGSQNFFGQAVHLPSGRKNTVPGMAVLGVSKKALFYLRWKQDIL